MKKPAGRRRLAANLRLLPVGTRRIAKPKKRPLPRTQQRDDFMFMPMEKCARGSTRGRDTRASVVQVSGIPK